MATFNPKASEVVHTPQFESALKRALTLILSQHNVAQDNLSNILSESVSALQHIVDFNQNPPPRPFKCAFDYFASRDDNKRKACFSKEKLREIWQGMRQSMPDMQEMADMPHRVFPWETKDYYEELHQLRIEEWDEWKLKETGAAAYQLFVETHKPCHPTIAWEALSNEERQDYVDRVKESHM